MKRLGVLATSSVLLLAACGSQEQEQEQVDFAAFDQVAIEKLVENGENLRAIEIIRGREQLNIATVDDFLTSAEIYITLFNGVAAEVELEKAKAMGADGEDLILLSARTYLLQRKLEEAEQVLVEGKLTGEAAFQALLLRGDVKSEQEEFDAAKAFYRAAIEDQPNNYIGYVGLAQLQLNLGEISDADESATKAYALKNDDPIVLYLLGAVNRYLLKTDEAIKFLNAALEQNEQHYLAHLELAAIYIENNQFDLAQEQLDAVYALSPEDRMARYYSALLLASEGKNKEAETMLLRLGDLPKVYPPAARVYGHIAYRLGKYSMAQPYLEQFLKLVPGDRPTRLALAECFTRRGKAKIALKTLEPLLTADGEDLEANLQAAAAAGILGDVQLVGSFVRKSQELAEKGDVQDKDLVKTLGRRLAINRFQTGENEQAIKSLSEMYAEDNEDFITLTLLANLQMENGDVAAAEETASRMLELAPENPVSSNLMGAVRYRQRNTDDALNFYNRALELNPDYISALKNRGLVYLVQEKFVEAKADLKKVVDTLPNDAQARGMFGRALLETGSAKESLSHFQAAEEIFPQSAILHADHAEALATLGFYSTAIKRAERSISYAGNSEELVKYLNNLIAEWTEIDNAQREEERLRREKKREEREAERKKQQDRLKEQKEGGTEKTDGGGEKDPTEGEEEDKPSL